MVREEGGEAARPPTLADIISLLAKADATVNIDYIRHHWLMIYRPGKGIHEVLLDNGMIVRVVELGDKVLVGFDRGMRE